MASTIGVKIANGDFYSIFDENSSVKKKLILTTVHENQPSMQIDLFRSVSKAMNDAQYIGSLVVENIKPGQKGEPSIQMIISSNSEGDILAEVIDLDKGSDSEPNVLSVSLRTLDDADRNPDIQDFELENKEGSSSGLYEHATKIREKGKRKAPAVVFVIIALLLILGLFAAWFFFLGGRDVIFKGPAQSNVVVTEPVKPEPEKKIEPVIQNEPPPPEPAPVIVAPKEPPAPKPPVTRVRPPAPVLSYKVPAVIPREGAPYRIRWGDTLWDIAEAFYRNPWLYPRIARFNNIRNPDLIISGRTIRIPPRN
ncbi:MAG: LysM peptidoglycan-binding domain-containing protein [Treponema sp.]|jgi:hypothetical protein|nr:LysM peptidoglycan-binding domain-containing protein [Treponema sp.]